MKVLFVCGGNAARSQMAEAYFNMLAGSSHYATSAGTMVREETEKKRESPPEYTIRCMVEKGIDIEGSFRKQLTLEMVVNADRVVVMDTQSLPEYLTGSGKVEIWDVPDTKYRDYQFYCGVRDRIELMVKGLIAGI